jgi:hypothetical protein
MRKLFLLFAVFLSVFAGLIGAADLSTGKGASAYGDYYSTNYPSYAWDASNATSSEWTTNNAAGAMRNNTVDLNSTYTYNVTSLVFRGYDGSDSYYYQRLYAYYSNDNSTFTLGGSITGNTLGNRVINFSSGIQARYWRFSVGDPVGDGIYGYTSYAGIYGTALIPVADSLSISEPSNSTFIASNFTGTFNFSSVTSSTALVWIYLDGTKYFLGNYSTNSTNSTVYSGLAYGSHNYTILVQPATGSNVTESRYFSLSPYAFVGSPSLSSSAYETTNESFGVQILIDMANLKVSGGSLYWNNSAYANDTGSFSNYSGILNRTLAIPLLQVNNSNVVSFWNVSLVWIGNGTVWVVNSSNSSQALYFAYYPANFTASPSTVAEGSPLTETTGVTALYSYATLAVTNYLNGTGATATNSGGNWESTITAPTTAGAYVAFGTLNVSFGGASRLANSSNASVTVSAISLSNCSASTDYALNFTFLDEESLGSIYASMGATFNVTNADNASISHEFSFSWSNVTVARLCISPASAEILVTSIQEYDSNNASIYPLRRYFLANATLTNSSQNVNLLLLDQSLATLTGITLEDSAGVDQVGFTIQATRYYPGEGVYRLVGMGKTDEDGLASIYLKRNDASYRFFAYEESELVAAFEPLQIVTCDPGLTYCTVALILSTSTLETYFMKAVNLAVSCAWNNSTLNYVCPYSDPSGTNPSGVRLRCVRVGTYTGVNSSVCDESSTEVSGSLNCTLGDISNKIFFCSFDASYSPPVNLVAEFIDGWTSAGTLAESGAAPIITLAIVVAFGLMGSWNPVTLVAGSMVGVVLSWGVGALNAPWPAILALIIAALVIIVKMRT